MLFIWLAFRQCSPSGPTITEQSRSSITTTYRHCLTPSLFNRWKVQYPKVKGVWDSIKCTACLPGPERHWEHSRHRDYYFQTQITIPGAQGEEITQTCSRVIGEGQGRRLLGADRHYCWPRATEMGRQERREARRSSALSFLKGLQLSLVDCSVTREFAWSKG